MALFLVLFQAYVSVSHYGIRPFRVFLRSPITLRQHQLAGRRDVVSGSGLPTLQYKRSYTTSLRHSKTSSRFTPEAFNELSDERLATMPFLARLLQFCIPADCKDCSILRWLQQCRLSRLVREMLCDFVHAGTKFHAKTHTRSALHVLGWNMPKWRSRTPVPVNTAHASLRRAFVAG